MTRFCAEDLVEHSCRAAQEADGFFITVAAESAQASARDSDARRRQGHPRGALDGVPVAVKDVIDTAGIPTTRASEHFRDHIPEDDAAIIERLKAAGASIIGKTNCQEFSYGIRGDAGAFGVTSNPHDPTRIAGGSSSGSAAAVAQRIVPLAIGTDTAGSVRVPAALCGVVGFKPTYGLLNTDGVFPLSPSFDTLGLFTNSVHDVETALDALGALDPLPTDQPAAESAHLRTATFEGLRPSDPTVAAPYDAVVEHFAVPRRVAPTVRGEPVDFRAAYNSVRSWETYRVHRELFERAPQKYQPPVRSRLEADATVSADEVTTARGVIEDIQQVYTSALAEIDVLISPMVASLAPRADDVSPAASHDLRVHSVPWNVLGWPALSIPYWVAGCSLPQSVQIIGKSGDDRTVLRAGQAIEELLADL